MEVGEVRNRIENALGSHAVYVDGPSKYSAEIALVCTSQCFTLVEEPPDDDYIHVVTTIHEPEFGAIRKKLASRRNITIVGHGLFADAQQSMASILEQSFSLLRGAVVCCTGLPNETKLNLEALVSAMGGISHRNFTAQVTVLIAITKDSEKYRAAVKLHTAIVKPDWVHHCFLAGQLFPKADYQIRIMEGLVVCVTGLNMEERNQVRILTESHGGVYTPHLTRNCTHLIAGSASGQKYDHALQWNVAVVAKEWLMDNIERRGTAPATLYPVNPEDGERRSERSESVVEEAAEKRLEAEPARASSGARPAVPAAPPAPPQPAPQSTEPLDSYLDGCRVVLVGLDNNLLTRAIKLVSAGGGTRYRELRATATHVVAPSYDAVDDMIARSNDSVRCAVVTIDWLIDCYRNKQLMPSADYLLEPKVATGERELVRDVSQIGRTREGSSGRENGATDFSDFYATLQKGTNGSNNTAGANYTNNGSSGNVGMAERQVLTRTVSLPPTSPKREGLFGNSTFVSCGMSLKDKVELSRKLKGAGAKVLKSAEGVDPHSIDYVVCTVLTPEISSQFPPTMEYVAPLWVNDSCQANRIFPPSRSLLYTPTLPPSPIPQFSAFQISISQYEGDERVACQRLVLDLGATPTEELNRANNTHLLCRKATGLKYVRAKEWGIPVVTSAWLYECARRGSVVSCAPYQPPEPTTSSSAANAAPAATPIVNTASAPAAVFQTPSAPSSSSSSKRLSSGGKTAKPAPLLSSSSLPTATTSPATLTTSASAASSSSSSKNTLAPPVASQETSFLSSQTVNELAGILRSRSKRTHSARGDDTPSASPMEVTQRGGSRLRKTSRFDSGSSSQASSEKKQKRKARRVGRGDSDSDESCVVHHAAQQNLRDILKLDGVAEEPARSDQASLTETPSDPLSFRTRPKRSATTSNQLGGLRSMVRAEMEKNAKGAEDPWANGGGNVTSSSHQQHLETPSRSALNNNKHSPRNHQSKAADKGEPPHSPTKTEIDDLKTQTQVNAQPHEEEGGGGEGFVDENTPPRSQSRDGNVAYRFMLSSLTPDLKKYYMHIIQELGGVVHDELTYIESVTHVVAKDLRRSERIFHAVAARKKILRISFLDQSYKSGRFVEEEPHLWVNDPPPSLASPGQDADGVANIIRMWRTRGPPFAKTKVFLMLKSHREKHFALMLRNGGATVSGSRTKLKNQDFTLAFFEGPPSTPAQEQAFAHMRQRGIPCLSPEFIVSYLKGDEDSDLRQAQRSTHAIA